MVHSSLTHSKVSYEDTLSNISNLCEFISNEFKKRNIFIKHKLKLISQAEHHLSLNASFYGSEEYYEAASSIIKRCYETKYTMFDFSVFGWGSNDIPSLCSSLRKSTIKEINYIINTSMCQLCDHEVHKQLKQILDGVSADIIVIDLLSEVDFIRANMNSISQYIRSWAVGCNTFISSISKMHPQSHLILIEKYLPEVEGDKSINEILELMYKTFQSLNQSVKIIPNAPIYQNISPKHEEIYFYEAIVDYIHSL